MRERTNQDPRTNKPRPPRNKSNNSRSGKSNDRSSFFKKKERNQDRDDKPRSYDNKKYKLRKFKNDKSAYRDDKPKRYDDNQSKYNRNRENRPKYSRDDDNRPKRYSENKPRYDRNNKPRQNRNRDNHSEDRRFSERRRSDDRRFSERAKTKKFEERSSKKNFEKKEFVKPPVGPSTLTAKGFKFPNIYEIKNKIYTLSLTGEKTFPDEFSINHDGKLYREWDPTRSKLGAGILKGLSQLGFKEDSTVLYLGAAHGYTPSFMSDIITKGMIFGVDIAPQVIRNLIFVAHKRKNLVPILTDGSIDELKDRIPKVDFIFQDIAQRNQTQIFIQSTKFLKTDGFAMLAIKARSIDVSKKPKIIFREVREELEKSLTIVDYKELDPFEKDHCLFLCKKLV